MFTQINRLTFFEDWDNGLIDQALDYAIMANGRTWWILTLLAEKQFRNLDMEGL